VKSVADHAAGNHRALPRNRVSDAWQQNQINVDSVFAPDHGSAADASCAMEELGLATQVYGKS
jgi:hypothetical protein